MRKKDQSTEFLKSCLAEALFRLLREKNYDKITVGEIVASANVSRATYYRYFQSKDELLLYKINHLTDEWLGTIGQQETLSFERFLASYLQLIYDNRSYFRLLYHANKKGILEEYLLKRIVMPHEDVPQLYRQTGEAFCLLGIFSLWMKRDFKELPEELLKGLRTSPLRLSDWTVRREKSFSVKI